MKKSKCTECGKNFNEFFLCWDAKCPDLLKAESEVSSYKCKKNSCSGPDKDKRKANPNLTMEIL